MRALFCVLFLATAARAQPLPQLPPSPLNPSTPDTGGTVSAEQKTPSGAGQLDAVEKTVVQMRNDAAQPADESQQISNAANKMAPSLESEAVENFGKRKYAETLSWEPQGFGQSLNYVQYSHYEVSLNKLGELKLMLAGAAAILNEAGKQRAALAVDAPQFEIDKANAELRNCRIKHLALLRALRNENSTNSVAIEGSDYKRVNEEVGGKSHEGNDRLYGL